MAIDIIVPELGESVLEATVQRWLKKEGDPVKVGEALVELETDKVNLEVGAKGSGVLAAIKAQDGQDVKVGDVLGVIEEGAGGSQDKDGSAQEQPQPAAPPAQASSPETEPASEEKTEAESVSEKKPAPVVSPVASRLAQELKVDLAKIEGSGPEGRVTKQDVERYAQNQAVGTGESQQPPAPAEQPPSPPEVQPAPAAQQVTSPEETPAGSGEPPSRPDEQPASSGQPSAPPAAQPSPTAPPPPAASGPAPSGRLEERLRMSRRRRTIAQRMLEASQSTAMLTTFNEVDMGAVMDLRRRHNEAFQARYGVKLGITSFFIKASLSALKAFPRLNAEIQGEEMLIKKYYDIGVAVGSEEGLVVPVIRDAGRLSLAEIEQQIKDFATKTEHGTLSVEDLRGGTFTITNGGVFGSLLSTPILNLPQVGILGLHKIEDRPVARQGEIVIRPMMYVALSYDHRIVDGREAVQFLVHIKELIEDPQRFLLEI